MQAGDLPILRRRLTDVAAVAVTSNYVLGYMIPLISYELVVYE